MLAGLVLMACREGGGEFGAGASVRDSAGVTIVSNSEPAWPADSGWRVADAPRLDLGGPDALSLGDVVGAVRTPAGAIAVADGRAQVIRVFGPDGRLLRSLGRRGAGTGEFQGLVWVGHAGDTLLAFDLLSRRVTIFGSAGRTRTVQLQARGPGPILPLGRLEDGRLLIRSGGARFPFAGEEREVRADSALVLAVGPDGATRDTLVHLAAGQTFGVAIGSGDGRFLAPIPLPFGRRSSVVLSGETIVVGEGERYELLVHALDGTLLRRIRRKYAAVPVTPEAVAAFRATAEVPEDSRGLQGRIDSATVAAFDSAPFPAQMPAFERVLADDVGNLWVLEYSIRLDQPRRWSVFTPEGRWLGDVLTPAGLRIEDVGSDWLLGVWRDNEGADRVRMYRIIHPGKSEAVQ